MTERLKNYRPKPRRAIYSCLMVLAVLFSVLIVGLYCLGLYVRSQYSAAELARMHEYDTKIIHLPPDWYKPVKLPPVETVKAVMSLSAAVEHFKEQPEHSAITKNSRRDSILFKLQYG